MNAKTVRYTTIGAVSGAVAGAVAAAAVTFALSLNLVALIWLMSSGAIATAIIGAVIGYAIATALPEMLPHYRSEHEKLRQACGQLKRNFKRLKWSPSVHRRLDEILIKDAELRHQATMLKKTISLSAQVSWQDRMMGGKQLIQEHLRTPGRGKLNSMEWTISSYRAKLDREVQELAVHRMRATDPVLKRELDNAYNIKYEELSNFVRFETAIERIEVELTKIRASFDSALLQTTRMAHVDLPRAVTPSLAEDTLLEDLHQELRSFDDAIREVLEVKSHEEILANLERTRAMAELDGEMQQQSVKLD